MGARQRGAAAVVSRWNPFAWWRRIDWSDDGTVFFVVVGAFIVLVALAALLAGVRIDGYAK